MIDRKLFFAELRRALFKGGLSQPQVEGIDAILDEWERRGLTDLRWLAYIFATAYHETARTMQPVIETRQPSENSNPSVDVAIKRLEKAWAAGKMPWVKRAYWRKDSDSLSWLGRGLPQVTHKDNYAKAEKATGVPFTKDPGLMLVMANAVPVMFDGMIGGWFTGKKLVDYFSQGVTDWRNARRIINATERAEEIAVFAKAFYSALMTADAASGASQNPAERVSAPAAPSQPPAPKPQPTAQPAPARPGFWAWLAALAEAFKRK